MKEKKMLSDFSLPELQVIQKEISGYRTIEDIQKDLNQFIQKKEQVLSKNPNIKFDRDMFVKLHIFDPWELKVLDFYQIHNLQELIDYDLDCMVDVLPSVLEKLEWARNFYDLRGMVSPDLGKQLVKSGVVSPRNYKK